jgi:predicted DNA-binding protein
MDVSLRATLLPFRMSKNITIPVRLDPEQAAAIKRYATRFSVTEAQIIRWAIDAFLRYVDSTDSPLRIKRG